jgi:hypothetical protein
MAVTWVAGTHFSQTTGTSIAVNAPAGLADGDALFAAVQARSAVTPPSGWTLTEATADFTDGTVTQKLSVYEKDATVSGDSSASFTWSQASSHPIAVAYAAARGMVSISSAATKVDSDVSGFMRIAPTNIPGTATGQLMLLFVSITEGDPFGAVTGEPSPPASFTLFTQEGDLGTPVADMRMAGARRAVNSGQGVSGYFYLDTDYAGSDPFGVGAVTLLLTELPPEPEILISVAGPLGAPALLARIPPAITVSVSGPLGSPALLAWHDLSSAINADGVARYYMDLITPDGDVRVPISSWQATLQTDSAQYVQCVVPACTDLVDDLTAATEFRLSRLLTLTTGETLEYQIAQAPLDTVQYARGSTNYTATLSGYIDEAAALTWPAGTERVLQGVQTIFTYSTGLRVRCSIDWLLQPGQSAQVEETVFTVNYINYIVSGTEAYMDVGERLEV